MTAWTKLGRLDKMMGLVATYFEGYLPGEIVDINRVIRDPVTGKRVTDIDLDTKKAIIEAKTGEKMDKPQNERHNKNSIVNPKKRPVLVYMPNATRNQAALMEADGSEVVRSLDDLIRAYRAIE